VDIALQTVKNSGPSERKTVQVQICSYIWGIFSPFVANYPKKSLYSSTLTKPLRQFHDLQRNIHRLTATTFVLVIEPIKNKKLNSERFVRNPLLLAQPQTFVLHQILRHVSSSEFSSSRFLIGRKQGFTFGGHWNHPHFSHLCGSLTIGVPES